MPRRLNPEWVSGVLELINDSPFLRTLDVKVDDIGLGFASGSLEVKRCHLNAFGGFHGGMYAALIDNMTYWAMYGSLPEGMGATTLDLNCSYLRACTEGERITCSGKLIKQGSTIILCDTEVRNAEGKLLAHGTSKVMASSSIQSPEDMYATVRPGYRLPKKFLDD